MLGERQARRERKQFDGGDHPDGVSVSKARQVMNPSDVYRKNIKTEE